MSEPPIDYYSDIQRHLDLLKIGDGMHLLVHSGIRYLGKSAARPKELTQSLIDRVGSSGCILMPTYPNDRSVTEYIHSDPDYDPRSTPAVTGVIPTLFMDEFPTRRSYHPWLSVSGLGQDVESYLDEHHLALKPYAQQSPHYKLCSRENGYILLMGIHEERNSCFHVIESLRWPDYPAKVYEDQPVTMRYKDRQGIEHQMQTLVPHRPAFPNWRRFAEDLNARYPHTQKVTSPLGYDLILIHGPSYLDAMQKALDNGMFPYNKTYMYHPGQVHHWIISAKRAVGLTKPLWPPRR
jgi:aminoglycoside N3'-acetyltransferase